MSKPNVSKQDKMSKPDVSKQDNKLELPPG